MWVEKLQLLRLPIDTHDSRKLVGAKETKHSFVTLEEEELRRETCASSISSSELICKIICSDFVGIIISVAATLPHHKKHAQP
jgi:hypothetical protein